MSPNSTIATSEGPIKNSGSLVVRSNSPTLQTIETAESSAVLSAASRPKSLRLSMKKRASGFKEKSSLFASFTNKSNPNKLPANSCHPSRVSELPGAEEGKIKANISSNSLKHDDKHQSLSSSLPVNHATLGAAEMADLLDYNSQDEYFSDDEEQSEYDPQEFQDEAHHDNRHRSVGSNSRASGSTSFDDDEECFDEGELNSVTLLKRLGDNPTETEMAQVALSRATESIKDCFSVGVDQAKFENIPTYDKNDMLIGQHLGKGSFSDVFEVSVTVRKETPDLNTLLSDVAIKTNVVQQGNTDSQDNHQSTAAVSARPNGRRRAQRRSSMSGSVCVGSMGRPQFETARQGKRMTLAMKCLRPQARSNFDHFLVGVEDLIHETAILSTLDHPNIIKLWGRAGDVSSFKLSDGYFILLDKLQDTLQDRIDWWAKDYPNARKNAPSLNQIKVACDISDALSYLHMSNIVFRDLKPANVGFDASGQLKLFDFGFAAKIAPEGDNKSNDPHLLNEICGTLRYMAPEVSAALDYGKEVDVYSFGILLWEICAATKPFSNIMSTRDFKNKVYGEKERPKLGKYWRKDVKYLLKKCWSSDPTERPTMNYIKSMLTSSVCEMKAKPAKESSSFGGSLRRSFTLTRRSSFQ